MSETDAVVVRDHDEQGSGAGGTSDARRCSSPSRSSSASGAPSASEMRATSARTCGSSASVRAMPRAVDSASARSCCRVRSKIHAGAQGDDEGHRGELEQQGARGEPWSGRRRPRHRASPVALRAICAEPTLRAQRKECGIPLPERADSLVSSGSVTDDGATTKESTQCPTHSPACSRPPEEAPTYDVAFVPPEWVLCSSDSRWCSRS